MGINAKTIREALASVHWIDPTEGRTYEIRKVDARWSFRIVYPNGRKGSERGGYWTEEAARAAARDVRDGKEEWHS